MNIETGNLFNKIKSKGGLRGIRRHEGAIRGHAGGEERGWEWEG